MMRVTVLSLALGTAAASFATREANLREIDELNNAEPEGGAVFKPNAFLDHTAEE
eukprot:CAMPEP_0119469390 /NCGR_PEP_ID=MMETSP1344-20130328/2736_1 /TAXON_ID=236787 /ORGANISM="Florenciella parvula, Strain CCMP2471" /LENGTH=54 /DNA_ID=CAMNT_0007501943 /DNA_START=23 /DNA_END=184 /DNA_ORIENTATION=-